jgi:5'-3' exonuclease
VPTVVYKGRKRAEINLYSTHEEADIRLVNWACQTDDAQVCVVSDDTDVFALLCYHYQKSGSSSPLMMRSSVYGRACIDIPETVKKHSVLTPEVLAIHGISGCDTVAACYGIGKTTAVTIIIKEGVPLEFPWCGRCTVE